MASYQSTRYYDSAAKKDCLYTFTETSTVIREATVDVKRKVEISWSITFNVFKHNTNTQATGYYYTSLSYNINGKKGSVDRAAKQNGDIVAKGSFTTESTSYNISLNASIYDYGNNVSLSKSLNTNAGYTLGSAGSATIVDNGDNTFTITGVVGQAGKNNEIIDAYLNCRTDNKDCTTEKYASGQNTVQLSTTAGSSESITLDNKNGVMWPGNIGARALVVTKCKYNTASSANARLVIKYYSAPTGEVAPVTLTYSGKQPQVGQTLTFSWKTVTCDKYRIWLYVNDNISTETFVTTASYTIPMNIELNVGDVISLAVQPVNVDKKNNLYYGKSAQSSEYTLSSAATIHVKVDGTWKSGTPFVKVDGVWKQASGVFVKSDGVWKQSV